MENEKEKKFTKPQIFYFNEQGQLVVESNKGIWVDGEQYVKMYGRFECNAKTLEVIIKQFRGIQVDADTEEENAKWKDIAENYMKALDYAQGSRDEIAKELGMRKSELRDKFEELSTIKLSVKKYNRLPWWKRMFKKVKV